MEDLLVGLTVGFPVVAGLASLSLKGKTARRILVTVTTLVLIASALLFLWRGQFTYTPGELWDDVVVILDFALLFYFLYIGFRIKHPLVVLLTLAQLIPLIYFEAAAGAVHVEPTLVIDYLAIIMCFIICVIGSLICVYGLSYMDEHEEHLHLKVTRQPRFFLYMILFLGAMNGLVFSNNIYWLYFFWEVTTLCCYQLIRHDETPQAERNAALALWMGLIGGVAFVASLFIGHYQLGTLALQEMLKLHPAFFMLLTFACLALAAFTKSAQVPFHSWLLGAMIAPTPVSALLHSSTMVKAGVYLVLRIAPALQGTPLSLAIALVGGLSFLVTAVLAVSQRESKRILAYSTIGNLGLIILCAGVNTPLAMVAALLLLVFHAMSKALLFLGAGIVENRVYSRNIEDWEGLIVRFPMVSTIMLVGMATMFLPPFGMLVGKWATMEAVAASPVEWALTLIAILAVGSAATTFFWAKWMAHLLFHPPTAGGLKAEKLQAPYLASTLTITALDIALSVVAALVVSMLVIPTVKPWYSVELSLPMLNLSTAVGAFPIWPLFLILAIAVALAWVVAKGKGGIVKPPYLCGENVPEAPTPTFRSTADLEFPFEASGMFFDRALGEPRTNRFVTAVGILLVLVVFAVVVI